MALIFALLCVHFGLAQSTAKQSDKRTNDLHATANLLTPDQIDRSWILATRQFATQRQRILSLADQTIATGPFRDDWESLSMQTVPDWYRDAKFGIFIHWGVFSVPASGSEWYSRNMYLPSEKDFAHHMATFGPQTKFGYKDFIPQFRMEHFDPAAWASLFERAGARYVVPVAEHHDGFPLYNSDLTEWSAAKMGPHRDLYGDLAVAIRANGMKLGASSHRAEHDWFFDGGRKIDSDINDPKYASLYGPAQIRNLESEDDAALSKDFTYVSAAFREDWLARTSEIVEKYHPDLLYFDWWVGQPSFRETERRFAAFYYNYAAQHQQAVVMNYKFDNMHEGAGVLDVERGQLPGIRVLPWQTDTSLSNESWGYIDGDTYKQPTPLIHELVDVVSKNGNLLLNIGPRADGTIPEAAQQTLLEIGGWLNVNGEAIYGSRPWTKFGEGPTQIATGTMQDKVEKPFTPEDYRFTTNKGFVYAIELGWPVSGESFIRSFASPAVAIGDVTLLGYGEKLAWHQKADGLHIKLPASPVGHHAYTFRISLKP
ncbi:alpha-L-fucosidase [Granulicella aggregans]|uniref:alpha-L-fucosidase n=1 Tax=Granulicella aggregans TaxID=474949 RepID=A0A7W8E299_9BACT|nr:alpha-L-fucosidase [Granulicella aggregans]MBB5055969.1 alpha-L-fucosidase [Granulicella aggregans]